QPYNGIVRLFSSKAGGPSASGSGFVIGSNAILTSAHVIEAMVKAGVNSALIVLPNGQIISFDPHSAHISNGYAAAMKAGNTTSQSARAADWAVIYTPTNLLLNGVVPFVLDTTFSGGSVNVSGFPSALQNNQIGTVSAVSGASLFKEDTEFSV